VAATRALLARGITPTVEQSADEAAISRTTAYRYFPNQRALIVAAHPELEADSLLGPDPPADPATRLDAVVRAISRLTLDGEAQLRSMLRLSLDPDPARRGDLVLRRGRRIGWVEDALAPVHDRMSPARFRSLSRAIAAVIGIDVLVWLVDVARMSRRQAVELMRWSALALLRAALADERRVDAGRSTTSGRRKRNASTS